MSFLNPAPSRRVQQEMRTTIATLSFLLITTSAASVAFAQRSSPMLSGDGKRIAMHGGVLDAGGGINEASICPVFEAGQCELFNFGGWGGEGHDAARTARSEASLKRRLEEGQFKPMLEVPLQSKIEEKSDFAPIRVKRRHVRVTSGEWTIDVRGKRRFAISLRGGARKAHGVVSCGRGMPSGAVTSAVLAQDGERVALWVMLECADEATSGNGWERVALEVSPAQLYRPWMTSFMVADRTVR